MKTRIKDIWRYLSFSSTYNPNLNTSLRYILRNKKSIAGRIDTLFCPEKILDQYQLFVDERILELPFVYRALDALPNAHILEVGCATSRLSLELASIGAKVVSVDLRDYPLQHPNLKFIRGDFFEQKFSEATFDSVITVSVVEHVGLGAYGENKKEDDSDRKIVEAFFRILKPGGQLILTVPFGKWHVTSFYRIYDANALGKLLHGFVIDRQEYYRRENYSIWVPSTAAELSEFSWSPIGIGAEGVALIAARRPKNG